MRKIIRSSILIFFVLFITLAGSYLYRTHEAVVRVGKYRTQVEQQLDKYDLKGKTPLVLAIIYTETKGNGPDVMQSSESLYGNGQTNRISSEQESITQGIAHLVEMLEYAEEKGCDIWTAIQAYNYGKAYIDYIANHGGENTLDLSHDYSREIVAPSLGNTTAETYMHLTWESLFYNGGKLYKNGGNLFYAREVRSNLALLRISE